jgi:hypothetical protein
MITAKTISRLSSYHDMSLTRALHDSGYRDDCVFDSEFVGITNTGRFCYKIRFREDGELLDGKVFLSEDEEGVRAEY